MKRRQDVKSKARNRQVRNANKAKREINSGSSNEPVKIIDSGSSNEPLTGTSNEPPSGSSNEPQNRAYKEYKTNNKTNKTTSSLRSDVPESVEGEIVTEENQQPEPEPHDAEPTEWQKQVGALCWVCHGHDQVSMLTVEEKGALTREASQIFKKNDFTVDDLRLWYTKKWKQEDWRGQKGQRPHPSWVRSGIASVRDTTPEPGSKAQASMSGIQRLMAKGYLTIGGSAA